MKTWIWYVRMRDICRINNHNKYYLREPLSILIKYKTIDTPKIESILKIYFDVSTKL